MFLTSLDFRPRGVVAGRKNLQPFPPSSVVRLCRQGDLLNGKGDLELFQGQPGQPPTNTAPFTVNNAVIANVPIKNNVSLSLRGSDGSIAFESRVPEGCGLILTLYARYDRICSKTASLRVQVAAIGDAGMTLLKDDLFHNELCYEQFLVQEVFLPPNGTRRIAVAITNVTADSKITVDDIILRSQ